MIIEIFSVIFTWYSICTFFHLFRFKYFYFKVVFCFVLPHFPLYKIFGMSLIAFVFIWLIDWLIEWLFGWLFIAGKIDWLIDWLINAFVSTGASCEPVSHWVPPIQAYHRKLWVPCDMWEIIRRWELGEGHGATQQASQLCASAITISRSQCK